MQAGQVCRADSAIDGQLSQHDIQVHPLPSAPLNHHMQNNHQPVLNGHASSGSYMQINVAGQAYHNVQPD